EGGAAFGGDGGIEVGGDVLGAGLDGVGGFGQICPGERFVEALDHHVGAVIGTVDEGQPAFLQGDLQPGAADGQDAGRGPDGVQDELCCRLCGGDDSFRGGVDAQLVELVGDHLRGP